MKMYIGIIPLFIFAVLVFAAEDDWMKKANSSKGAPNFNGKVQNISIESSRLRQNLGLQAEHLHRENQNGSIPVRFEQSVLKSGLSGNKVHRSDANGNSPAPQIQSQ